MFLHNVCPRKVKCKQVRLLRVLKRSSLIMQDQKLCFVFSDFVFFLIPNQMQKHKANKFSSNEGEYRESDGFYLQMKESYKAKKAEVDNFASVFTQMISSNQLSSTIKINDCRAQNRKKLKEFLDKVRCSQISCNCLINSTCGWHKNASRKKNYQQFSVTVQVYFWRAFHRNLFWIIFCLMSFLRTRIIQYIQ